MNPVDPIHHTPTTPVPAIPGYGEPQVGSELGGEEQAPFSLPLAPHKQDAGAVSTAPSPLELAGQTPGAAQRLTPEQIATHMQKLQDQFGTIRASLQDQNTTNALTPTHYAAMQKILEQTTPSLASIANATGGQFQVQQHATGQGGHRDALSAMINWLDGSQKTLGGALNYLGGLQGKQPSIESMFRLQVSVQQATQRAELFASAISATVGGIKTIMSTQV